MQNRWYWEGKISERHRWADNMKVGVKICAIKSPGDSPGMPDFEMRPEREIQENSVSRA
jgi:hypothetical protein